MEVHLLLRIYVLSETTSLVLSETTSLVFSATTSLVLSAALSLLLLLHPVSAIPRDAMITQHVRTIVLFSFIFSSSLV